MKNFVLHHYPSLTVQEVEITREQEDGEKRSVITWSMKYEVGEIGPVKPSHMVFSGEERVFSQGSIENLAAMQSDVLFTVHAKRFCFHNG